MARRYEKSWFNRFELAKVRKDVEDYVESVTAEGIKEFYEAAYPKSKVKLISNPWEEVNDKRLWIDGKIFKPKDIARKLRSLAKETNDLQLLARMRSAYANEPVHVEKGPIFVVEREWDEAEDGSYDEFMKEGGPQSIPPKE